MNERLVQELDLLKQRFGADSVEMDPNGAWVRLIQHTLIQGWNMTATPVLVKLLPSYPTTGPDNFYTAVGLRTASGAMPGNAPNQEAFAGQTYLQFSYHLEAGDWNPHSNPQLGHNLVTYFEGVLLRLEEPN